jgi:succinate dehydrogenase / fumarate reductase cytochrome b subunit
MNWYMFVLGSSVGKKMLMAVTGLCLIGFLAVHLLGNFMAFAGADAFNGYAAKLHSLQPYLTIFNIGLATLGLVHIVIGIILFFENLKARPTKYDVYKNPGGRTIGSNTMPYTALLILAFIILHLLKFTFVDKSATPIFQLMSTTFANPLWVLMYVVAMIIVAVHISHGFWSLFQTFGVNHPRYMPLIMNLGLIVTFAFGIGFASLPVYLYLIK